jgi:hypothetical protein
MRRVIRIEANRRFPISARERFDYVTDPAKWPAYRPRLVPSRSRLAMARAR